MNGILNSTEIVIIGGAGFVGIHLINTLLEKTEFELAVLVHQTLPVPLEPASRVRFIDGNIFDGASLAELIPVGSIVVNLVYLGNGSREDNLKALSNLLEICHQKTIKRFVHCSTAVVSGRAKDLEVTESTVCEPYNNYEKTKVALEDLVSAKATEWKLEAIIVRPTCVFGENGQNLLKVANDLSTGSLIKRYLKSCLYNTRKMNLVPVKNVVSAIEFLMFVPMSEICETFIVSSDEDPDNHYWYVEDRLLKLLALRPLLLPPVALPKCILTLMLKLLNRSNLVTEQVYSSAKLRSRGWVPPVSLDSAIKDFADWYCQR